MNKLKITILFIFIVYLIPFTSLAQNITGKIVDQEDNPLEYVAVAIINPTDSLLLSYANTDKFGAFELKKIPEGTVLFQAHLIGFKTYQKTIEYKNKSIALGNLKLEFENELDEVVVEAVIPISIKKDTVAYNTKAFKIRPEDSVEDLLKKLPGVEVDETGKVTAQGEDITKIYVDGKEFFSGDPAIATKNLSADAIKSIEVIDEQSEKSRVSGVNDLERKKVINLKLKDDKKVNDFGKAQGGYGTDDRFLTSLNYNRFSSKMQTSIIGKYNNVNTSGSDISEVISFNGGRGNSGNSSAGFLTTGVGGFNIGYELKKDQNLNADYFYNYSDRTSGDVFRNRTEYIGDLEIRSESHSKNENVTNANKVNFGYNDKSKKLSSFRIDGNANLSRNDGESISTLDKYNGQGELDLQSIGKSNSQNDNNSGNISFYYTKRFKEDSKRHFSTEGEFSASNSDIISNNNQLNRFNVATIPVDNTHEITKEQNKNGNSTDFELEYTEPITENHLIEINGQINHNSNDNNVFQSDIEDGDNLNPNILDYNEFYTKTSTSGRIRYKYDRERFSFSTGARLIEDHQNFGLENDVEFDRKYTNINPELSIRYNPERGEFVRFRLRNSVNLPNSSQLSPAVNNFNPLYIRQGNPDLTPSDNYSVYALYGKHNFASGFSFFTRISYNHTKNSIGNTEETDLTTGVRTSSYANLGDKDNFSSFLHFGNRLNSLGIRYRIRLSGNYNEYFTMINNEINGTQSKDGSIRLSFENNKKDNIDASIGATWRKNFTSFTSGNNANRDYFQQTYYTKFDWNVSNRFNVNTQFKYDIYTDSNFGTDQAIPIWNATLSYALTASKSLTVLVSALDILNKSIGIERNSSDNYFEEVYRDVLGNYYMLSLNYNLNGNKNPNAKPSRGHRRHSM